MATSKRTHDHDIIRDWVEERGGVPSIVRASEDASGGGFLRIDFGEQEEDLDEISWDQFFEIFERNNLDFVYQDESDDMEESLFFKFVTRE